MGCTSSKSGKTHLLPSQTPQNPSSGCSAWRGTISKSPRGCPGAEGEDRTEGPRRSQAGGGPDGGRSRADLRCQKRRGCEATVTTLSTQGSSCFYNSIIVMTSDEHPNSSGWRLGDRGGRTGRGRTQHSRGEAGRQTLASRGGIPATSLTTVQPWASDLSFLCLSFLVYEMTTVVAPHSQLSTEDGPVLAKRTCSVH